MKTNKLQLQERQWFSYQRLGQSMMPAPWNATPVFLQRVQPLKTGKGILRLEYIAALHPIQAKVHCLDLKVLVHNDSVIIAALVEELTGPGGNVALHAFGHIDFGWVEQHCTRLWTQFPPNAVVPYYQDDSGPETYLAHVFGEAVEQICSGATKDSFSVKRHPLPKKNTTVLLNRTYDAFNAYWIRRGHIPLQMEDKWFIFVDQERLFMHRSWTGYCIYEIELQQRGTEMYVGYARVNRNPKQYSQTNDAYDLKLALHLIDRVLLNLPIPYPNEEE